MAHVEAIHTNERVPGHDNYYEKNGLRTYGDDEDHDHEPKMSFKRIMSLIAMAFRTSTHELSSCRGILLTGSSLDRLSDSSIPLRYVEL